MLRIRKKQFSKLSETVFQGFIDRAVKHLKKAWPRECDSAGEKGVIDSIEVGVKKAEEYGIRAERDVIRYIDVMYLLGHDFDNNDDTEWAGRILEDCTLPPTVKMDRLWRRVKDRLLRDRQGSLPTSNEDGNV